MNDSVDSEVERVAIAVNGAILACRACCGGDEVLAERSPAEKVDAVRLARFGGVTPPKPSTLGLSDP